MELYYSSYHTSKVTKECGEAVRYTKFQQSDRSVDAQPNLTCSFLFLQQFTNVDVTSSRAAKIRLDSINACMVCLFVFFA